MHYFSSFSVGRLILTGDDRAKFLHNFCTADIKRMQVGEVREAFILNVKGKLLGLVHVLCRESSLELISWPNQTAAVQTHLDRYLIREKVQFHAADEPAAVLLFGTPQFLAAGLALPPSGAWQRCATSAGDMVVAGGDFCGPGWLCLPAEPLLKSQNPLSVEEFIRGLDVAAGSDLEWWRVSHSVPCFGTDADEETLPQELQRDVQAISFEKGCYLGQETVARIDALGHVNRLLVQVQIEGAPLPTLPAELQFEGTRVGSLTSIATRGSEAIGLATIKRALAKPGTRLECGNLQVVVK